MDKFMIPVSPMNFFQKMDVIDISYTLYSYSFQGSVQTYIIFTSLNLL